MNLMLQYGHYMFSLHPIVILSFRLLLHRQFSHGIEFVSCRTQQSSTHILNGSRSRSTAFNNSHQSMDSVSPNAKQSTNRSIESRSNKRRKIESVPLSLDSIKWRSSTEQISYSSKLVEALRRISSPSNASSHSRLIRETTDKVLAIAARGRSRWSRAILAKRCKLQLKNHKKISASDRLVRRTLPRLPHWYSGTLFCLNPNVTRLDLCNP